MENYLDKIMTNHVFDSSESSDINYLFSEDLEDVHNASNNMTGGVSSKDNLGINDSKDSEPTGGFPPIYILDKKTDQEKIKEQSKNRELANIKSAISIKDILAKKK